MFGIIPHVKTVKRKLLRIQHCGQTVALMYTCDQKVFTLLAMSIHSLLTPRVLYTHITARSVCMDRILLIRHENYSKLCVLQTVSFSCTVTQNFYYLFRLFEAEIDSIVYI